MKILLWNCNNGMSKEAQISYFNSFRPDLAIIPELKEHNISSLSPSSAIWATNNHEKSKPKGLGVLGFNGVMLEQLETDGDMEIFLPIKVFAKEFSFNLPAVWNFYWACKQGRFKNIRGEYALEYEALRHYLPKLKAPLLIAGDWNLGPTFAQEYFFNICTMMRDYKIESLYHQFHNLHESKTNHATFRSTSKTYHHLDHIFGSDFFQRKLKSIDIPKFEDVKLSDHAPISADFDF